MSRSPILEYADANPITEYYVTEPTSQYDLTEDGKLFVTEEGYVEQIED